MSIGTVYGVGLGSGDVDLLSVRADRLVRNAKIIAYFRKAGKKGSGAAIGRSTDPRGCVGNSDGISCHNGNSPR